MYFKEEISHTAHQPETNVAADRQTLLFKTMEGVTQTAGECFSGPAAQPRGSISPVSIIGTGKDGVPCRKLTGRAQLDIWRMHTDAGANKLSPSHNWL